MPLVRHLALITSLLALAVTVHASGSTFIVDDTPGPGVDFADIPSAIAAAAPGDVLLVQPGTYGAFDLNRGLTIMGVGTPSVLSAGVRNLPGAEVAVLVGLDVEDLEVMVCAGTVIVQEMSNVTRMRIENANDVRLHDVSVLPPTGPTIDALRTQSARVEAVQCTFRGSSGTPLPPPIVGERGGHGVNCDSGSRLHMTSCNVSGGRGGDTFDPNFTDSPPFNGGFGGDGMRVQLGAEAIVGRGSIDAGGGGICLGCLNCFNDGIPGNGVTLLGDLRRSGTSITSPSYLFGAGCLVVLEGTQISFGNTSTLTEPPLQDPALELSSVPMAGLPVQLTVQGEPGDVVELHFGRSPLRSADPGVVIEKLTTSDRVFKVGIVPASGVLMVAPTVPVQSNVGSRFFCQAEVRRPSSGELPRSNSIPLIVH